MAFGTKGSSLGHQEIATLRRIVDADGVVLAAQRLGVARHTLERSIAGLGIRAGSAALLRLSLSLRASEIGAKS